MITMQIACEDSAFARRFLRRDCRAAFNVVHSKTPRIVLESSSMSMRRHIRAAVALFAAYAVALQMILLALIGPMGGATQFAAQPICSSFGTAGTGSVPTGHSQDCLAACLTGCCCGVTAVPVPGATVAYAPEPAQTVTAVIEATAAMRPGMTAAHRSRAPPLA
jgi:hypothetical protein